MKYWGEKFQKRQQGSDLNFLRPYYTKISHNKKALAILALPLILSQIAFAQDSNEVYKQELSFTLEDIHYNTQSSIAGSLFAKNLISKYKGQRIDLIDVKNIENQIRAHYTQELEQPQAQVVMTLPFAGNGILSVKIHERIISKRPKKESAIPIEAISFSGNISINAEDVLNIANTYTNQPYSLVKALNLRKELKSLYQTNNISATITLPELDPSTGDLYIHIEERFVKKALKSATLPTLQKDKNQLHEVSNNIFVFKPMPQEWKEPKWLTQPVRKKTAKNTCKKNK